MMLTHFMYLYIYVDKRRKISCRKIRIPIFMYTDLSMYDYIMLPLIYERNYIIYK